MQNLRFDNAFVAALPADDEVKVFPRQVKDASFSYVTPAKASKPKLVARSDEVAALLGLKPEIDPQEFINVFSGNQQLAGMQPYAMRYGGHQFGHWAGQLGDGRAINLGEVLNEHNERWALQLKGSGLTPYSRTADGLAVLRSSVREFLCSEAMHHLGVPTTRALSLMTTGDQVVRDMFYDGNAKPEPGAVVCRVAPSFIRFGSFQIHAAYNELESLKALTDFTIKTYYPHLCTDQNEELTSEVYLQWLASVMESTIAMIVHWQRVGFVHGVMNTDNMSIHGLTIDYGPYGWLDNFDPDWTPNTTDAQGKRYRFANQAAVAHWNFMQLAQAIYPLINEVEPLQTLVDAFPSSYQSAWQAMMREKLGLQTQKDTDVQLFESLEALLASVETDMSLFYRALASFEVNVETDEYAGLQAQFKHVYYKPEQITTEYQARRLFWFKLYSERLSLEDVEQSIRKERMDQVNPRFVLRNYLAQQAIDKAEQGDYSEVKKLLDIMRRPYEEQTEHEVYANKRPDWARFKAGCSMLSCSS